MTDEQKAKAAETRRLNQERRAERRRRIEEERAAQLAALRAVRDDPATEPGDRLKAVELIETINRL